MERLLKDRARRVAPRWGPWLARLVSVCFSENQPFLGISWGYLLGYTESRKSHGGIILGYTIVIWDYPINQYFRSWPVVSRNSDVFLWWEFDFQYVSPGVVLQNFMKFPIQNNKGTSPRKTPDHDVSIFFTWSSPKKTPWNSSYIRSRKFLNKVT